MECGRDVERQILNQRRQGGRLIEQLFRDDRPSRLAVERGSAGQHLIGHHCKRVLVAALIDVGFTAGLFRTHVLRRSDDHPGAGERFVARIDGFRDSEIHQPDMSVGALKHDILGLDIAMHDIGLMGDPQRVGGLEDDPLDFLDREPALPLQNRLQTLALDQRHQDVADSVRLADIVHRYDGRVLERGNRKGFATESLEQRRGQDQIGAENLDGEFPLQFVVANREDFGVSPAADQPAQFEVGPQSPPEPFRGMLIAGRKQRSGRNGRRLPDHLGRRRGPTLRAVRRVGR